MKATVKVLSSRVRDDGLRKYVWDVIHHGKLVASYATRREAREAAREIRRKDREP